MKNIYSFLIVIIFAVSISACNNTDKNSENNTDSLQTEISDSTETSNTAETIEDDYDYTAKYVCPMHCEGSGNDQPGSCPVCEMDLIENLDYQE